MRIRAGVAVLAALTLAPAAAWAYEEPPDSEKDLGRVEAEAGDVVRFELEGTDEGARWTAREEDGRKLGDGEDETEQPGAEGSFTVPDLGDEQRDVPVVIDVRHAGEGGDWRLQLTLAYSPGAPAESGSAPRSEPEPAPAPVPAPAKRSSGPAPPRPVVAPASTVPEDSKPAPSAENPPEPEPAPVGSVLGQVRRKRVASGPAAFVTREAPIERRKAARRTRRARRVVEDFRPGPDPRQVHGRDVTPPRDTRVDLSDDDVPGLGWTVAWNLFVAVIVLGFLLPVLIGLRTRRRRRRQAEIEAELQEMLAEERAGELSRR